MKTLVALALLPIVGCLTPRAEALDFVLHAKSVEEDGFTKEQLYVRNDARSDVFLSLPTRWARVDGPATLTITPPDVRNSLVRLDKSPLAPSADFRDASLDVYRRRAQGDIPQGATNARCCEERDTPLPIFGWKEHEFVFAYDFYGQAYRRSILFVNLNAHEQITLTCVAPTEDFEVVREAGFDVLRSWQVVPSSD